MTILWILAGLFVILAGFCGIILLRSLSCRPVPDLSQPEKTAGTRWEPYAQTLHDGIASTRSQPWKEIRITGTGGIKLCGHLLRGEYAKTVILAHGWRSSGENDFCGILDYYRENGYSVLMVDQRGHGKSGGRRLSFGIRERRDMACWIRWTHENLPGDLWLHGVSMGAVSLLGALPLCSEVPVCGVIADSPYDSVRELMIYQAGKKYRLPKRMITGIVSLEGSLLFGKDFTELSASQSASASGVPVLVICGTEDRTVPPGVPAAFTKGKKTMCVFIPGGRHAMCWLHSPAVYERALDQFLSGGHNKG